MQRNNLKVIQLYTGMLLTLLLSALLPACQTANYTPLPTAYPRAELPEAHAYQTYNSAVCPFTFEYPTYARAERDSLFFNAPPENDCWINMKFTDLNAVVFMSYKPISKNKQLYHLVQDAYKLNTRHVIRADFIEDSLYQNAQGASGIWYEVGGDAASPYQFYITDSLQHFIWASLYFNNPPNEDSIAPIAKFIRQDLQHIINTFAWQD